MPAARQSSRASKAPTKFTPPDNATKNPRKRSSQEVEDSKATSKKLRAPSATATRPIGRPKKEVNGITKPSTKPSTKASTKGSATAKTDTAVPATKKNGTVPLKKSANTTKNPRANIAVKRKADNDTAEPAAKKAKKPAAVVKTKPLPEINAVPTQKLDVFVAGEGGMGELGLGTSAKAIDVKRPRLNPYLTVEKAGIVKLAVGGMHCVALTHDNKIITWGVNDHGALGRKTDWDGGLVDMDEASKKEDKQEDDKGSDADSDDDNGLNPRECTPAFIDASAFADDVKFVDCAAADNASFVLTSTGQVYGWGCFRDSNGVVGFHQKDKEIQWLPVLLTDLKNITKVVCGTNHVLALDKSGTAYGWGSGEQYQLGRKLVERTSGNALKPQPLPLPPRQIRDIFTGSDNGFAITKKNDIYSWGVNNFCECGHKQDPDAEIQSVFPPKKVTSLAGQNIVHMEGGNHHTVMLNDKNEVLTMGSTESGIAGIKLDQIPTESCVLDDAGRKRALLTPTVIGLKDVASIAAGTEHSLAITKEGKAYSWGFSTSYQTAIGTDEDALEPTLIDGKLIRDRQFAVAGGGGQYSVFLAIPAEAPAA